jgi:hypothetical protein
VADGDIHIWGVLCAPLDWIDARDTENYLSPYFARQSIEAMAPKFPNWLGRLHEYGVVTVPLALGSESAQYIDLFALQASRNPDVKVRAHDVRDTLPKIRPYKGW